MLSTIGARPSKRLSGAGFGVRLLPWAIALAALGVGVVGSGALDPDVSAKWLIIALALHAIPLFCMAVSLRPFRIYGAWLGVFLIAQFVLSPWLLGDARHYRTLLPNMSRTIEVVGDAMPGIQGIQRITTDARGFRVQPPIDYEHKRGFRIVAIGGSTTEQIDLDDRSTWTYLLQEELAAATGRVVEVINTGLSGTRALHQSVMLRRLLADNPDCALFLVGVNDWNKHIREHFGSDHYRRQDGRDRLFKWTLLGRALQAADWYVDHTIMGRSEPDLDGSVQAEHGRYYSEQNDSLNRTDQRTLAIDDVAPDYRAALDKISGLCREADLACGFITQPHGYSTDSDSDYRRHFWMTPPNESYTLDLGSMGQVAGVYNQHLIAFAHDRGHDLVDLDAAMPAGTTYFFDDVHFNTAGARRVADVLGDAFLAGACGFGDKGAIGLTVDTSTGARATDLERR